MTKDTALSGSDNLHLVRLPGWKQGDRARKQRGRGWFFGEMSGLGSGAPGGVRLGSAVGRCVLWGVHPCADRAWAWGAEVRPGDQGATLKKPSEAGTRVALWEQGPPRGEAMKTIRTSPFLPSCLVT